MQSESIGSFISENKTIVSEWAEARFELYRLKLIRVISIAAGQIVWSVVTIFLFFLLLVLIAVVAGFWFSEITGSYSSGFGLSALSILVIIALLAAFRKQLFINPIMRRIISKMDAGKTAKKNEDEED